MESYDFPTSKQTWHLREEVDLQVERHFTQICHWKYLCITPLDLRLGSSSNECKHILNYSKGEIILKNNLSPHSRQ